MLKIIRQKIFVVIKVKGFAFTLNDKNTKDHNFLSKWAFTNKLMVWLSFWFKEAQHFRKYING